MSAYDYESFNEENFLAKTTTIGKSCLKDDAINVSKQFDIFQLNLHNLVDKHYPKKNLSEKAMKLRNWPWINLQIQKMIKIRNNLFHQFKLRNSATDLQAYNQFRNRIVNKMRETERNCYHQYFDEYKNNLKMLWKGIACIISLKPGNNETISYLKDKNGSKLADPVKIATEFHEYFTNVANSITKQIPRIPKSPLGYLSNPSLQ